MDKTEWDKLRYQELIVLRSLLKKQNELLGASLKQSDHLIFLHKTTSLLSLEEISDAARQPRLCRRHDFYPHSI